MTGLKPVSWKAFVKRLKSFGFIGPFSGGRHLFMTKDNLDLTIPNPHQSDIGVDLLKRILKQAGITRDDWLKGL